MRLAVVDDDRDVRRALERLLRSHGHEVYVFESDNRGRVIERAMPTLPQGQKAEFRGD